MCRAIFGADDGCAVQLGFSKRRSYGRVPARDNDPLPSPSPVWSHQVLFVFCVPETASGKWRAAYGLAKDTVRYLCESNGAEVDKDIQVSSGAQINETYLDALCDTDF